MEKINIFNYEIFYLDFLDGNLSEENTSLLFSFLERHPELKMEDEFLPTLEENAERIYTKKEALKQPLFSDEINAENIEYFLIAQAENLLSKNEKSKLEAFLVQFPVYKMAEKQFNAIYLEADKTQIYTHKESLKKKRVLVLWPYISIAASLLLAFLIWNSSENTRIDTPPKQIAEDKVIETNVKTEKKRNNKENTAIITPPKKMIQENTLSYEKVSSKKDSTVDILPVKDTPLFNQPNRVPVLISFQEKKLHPVTPEVQLNPDNFTPTTSMKEEDMVNPIEPITAFLRKKTNTPIEYKKQNRTESQPKKLYIKIGKFEFYRKKH